MQAIILAAGMGKRLKELTKDNTKCMVKVDGVTLIDRMLHQIERQDVSRIIIVTGYEGEKLREYIGTLGIRTPIEYIHNPIYDKTNNIYSLALAKEWLCWEDTLLFESDIIFEDAALDALVQDERDTLALVDRYEPWMDGTCVRINEKDEIVSFIPGKQFDFSHTERCYKTVNIYKFSRHFSEAYYVPFLVAYRAALGENEYYEQVLRVIAMLDEPVIKVKRLNGQRWYEIDDKQDLDIAESMFAPDEQERVSRLQGRYGGYWRYPQMLDYCYLVNPYYPPRKMKEEMRASFDALLTNYPSGTRVNTLLASKDFNIHEENIIVGNGAAELIRSLMGTMTGKTGFIRPTFEEYPNRYQEAESVVFQTKAPDYAYTAQDVMDFFGEKEIRNLVIINPDNPSGNYLRREELLQLIRWSREKGIRIVIDESFGDFAEEEGNSLLEQELIDANPHLYVVKSISKSYGVPGLRLGIMAGGDTETIRKMKKEASIWNINSFAEFFLQIEEKYRKDYVKGLELLRAERRRFAGELKKIPGIRVIPSQANYLMVELTGGTTAEEMTRKLLIRHNIFVKDLTRKMNGGNYLRFAIRTTEENDRLLGAIREMLQ